MRSLAILTTFVVATSLGSTASAQKRYRNNIRTASYDSYDAKSTEISLSDRLVYERALFRAHHRDARIQARKWAGVSLSRPSIIVRPFHTFGDRDFMWHWAARHTTPVWHTESVR